jgi:hypothetical protein
MMALVLAATAAPALAQTPDPNVAAVWAQEDRYWADAQSNNFKDFLTLFDDRFTGWACDASQPETKAQLTPAPAGVTVTAALDRKTAASAPGVVVASYRAVQTASVAGAQQQQRILDFTHVWVAKGGGWKLIGGMCRDAPAD